MSTPSATPATPNARMTLTMICATMAGAIPLVTLVLWFVLAADDGIGEFPAGWPPLVVLAAAAGAYTVCEFAGFRTPPLEYSNRPAAEVATESWRRFTASTFTRFAVCEAVFLLSVTLSFVAGSYWITLIGAALALPLFFWEAWPSDRNIRRFAAALEAKGTPSYLTGPYQDSVRP
ncbi:hypothetical protein [Kribbella sp. NPDC048915]|uniref:hypothetical protein n=1 Tax=Kribbella sp. NPDC048915 TaxID=3155148 RepID=UPI0033D94434